MLILIALSAVQMQDPPAPPPPPEARSSHFVFMGAGGDGPGDIDANGDGQVTREEFAAPLNGAFGRMDKDGDGRLSRDELASDHGPGGGHVAFRRLGGGAGVERFELRRPGPGGERAARFERDGDHTVIFVGPDSPGDESRVVVRTLPDGGGPGAVHIRRGPGGERNARVEVRTVGGSGHGSDDLDKDGDGKISEAEFVAPLREAFSRMDADHSGFVEDGEGAGENQVHVFARRAAPTDGE